MARIHTALIATLAASSIALSACSTDADTDTATNSASEETSAASSAVEDSSDSSTAESDSKADSGSVTVTDNHGEQTIKQPVDEVVATDNRTFEMLTDWGVKIVAAPKPIVPFTLDELKNDPDVQDLGSHREPDLEVLAATQPDLVVNGQRFRKYYEDIHELTPDAAIVEFEPREGEPLADELIRQTTEMGKIFGKEDEAEKIVKDFEDAIDRAKKAYDSEKTVMAVNSSGGNLGYIAPSVGRTYGPIFDMLGLTPALEVDNASDDHQGDEISVEAIAQANPDILMVLDRDAGTTKRTTSEYQPAASVVEGSQALVNVNAVKNDDIYYAPEDTYTNESIITYTEILNGLAETFEKAK